MAVRVHSVNDLRSKYTMTMFPDSINRSLKLLPAVTLAALSGCASFLGPYQPLHALSASGNPIHSVQQGQVNQNDTTTGGPSSRGANPAWQAEFDTAVPPSDPQSNIEEVAADYGQVPVTPVTPRQTATTENPFAAMARERSEQASFEAPDPGVVKTSATGVTSGVAATSSGTTSHTTFHDREPRLATGQPGCPVPADVAFAASPMAQAYPDEYIFDGGDRDHPVHYYGDEMQGLNTEDTVVEFKDHEGDNHVTPSNRVAVYAPRFGAVQTISGPATGIKVDKAAGTTDVSGIGTLLEDRGIDFEVASSPASGLAAREGASGIETALPGHLAEKTESAAMANKVDQRLEAKTFDGLGIVETTASYEFRFHILEPTVSEIRTASSMEASTSQATQTYSTFKVQATVGSEEGGDPGRIHITKEANPLVAKPGDIITFKIHFQNVGDYNVHDVRIMDNLTPRLIYIDDSGQIDVADGSGGGLTVAPNNEGSQTLIFELDNPLKGGQSGTITFRAKVR